MVVKAKPLTRLERTRVTKPYRKRLGAAFDRFLLWDVGNHRPYSELLDDIQAIDERLLEFIEHCRRTKLTDD